MDDKLTKVEIEYPYLPEGRKILYVKGDNKSILEAKRFAKLHSLDSTMPTASIIVKGDEILAISANGSDYHKDHKCERVKQNISTGQGYELCEGCHPKNHSETRAVQKAQREGKDTNGADLYLWGHFWCCEPCWNEMIRGGIKNVYLMEESEVLFNKNNKNNIVGRQFEE